MDLITGFADRLLADPLVVAYWFLVFFFWGVKKGADMADGRWRIRVAAGEECAYCEKNLHRCQTLRKKFKREQENESKLDKILLRVIEKVLDRERRKWD